MQIRIVSNNSDERCVKRVSIYLQEKLNGKKYRICSSLHNLLVKLFSLTLRLMHNKLPKHHSHTGTTFHFLLPFLLLHHQSRQASDNMRTAFLSMNMLSVAKDISEEERTTCIVVFLVQLKAKIEVVPLKTISSSIMEYGSEIFA